MNASPSEAVGDCKSEAELDQLSNEALLAYVVEMREDGRDDCALPAFRVLAFGYWGLVASWVSEKVDPNEVEDLTATVIESALDSAFDGRVIGQFVNWLKTITAYRIADFYKKLEGKPVPGPLPSEHAGEEMLFGAEPEAEEQGYAAVAIREAAGRVLETRQEIHQLVIRLNGPAELGWQDLPAGEVAELVDAQHPGGTEMTADNVYQIWKRFKDDLEDELGLGGSQG